jgi:metal-responsive CopG/Arc/MetJ family transcriptional regulator
MPEAQDTIIDAHRMILLNARVPQAMLDDLDAVDGIDAPRNRSALVRRLLREGIEREQQRLSA